MPIRLLLEASTVAQQAMTITQVLAKQSGQEELAQLLVELEQLSSDATQSRLAEAVAVEQGRMGDDGPLHADRQSFA